MIRNLKINPAVRLKISARMKLSSSPRTCHNVALSKKKMHVYLLRCDENRASFDVQFLFSPITQ